MNVAAVYIDGSHHCEDVIVDIKLAMKLIGTKKGFVVFDDLHIPDVKAAVIAANFLYNGKFQRWNFPEHYIN